MYVEHGDAIFDGKHEAVTLTYQLITTWFAQNRSQHSRAKYGGTVAQPALADRAHQYIHQLLVHPLSLIPVFIQKHSRLLQLYGKFLERRLELL